MKKPENICVQQKQKKNQMKLYMYYLILGGGAIMGYKYSNDIRDWGIKQNNYLVDYFRKQHLIIY